MRSRVPLGDFKSRNKSNWERISGRWLTDHPAHIAPLLSHVGELIDQPQLSKRRSVRVAELGFGSAWLPDLLQEKFDNVTYLGIDANPKFVEAAENKFMRRTSFRFVHADLESDKAIAGHSKSRFDWVFCINILLETKAWKLVLDRAMSIVEPGGKFVLVDINPELQLLSISKDLEEYRSNLELYRKLAPGAIAYRRAIDAGKGEELAKHYYYGILRPTSLYVNHCVSRGFSVQRVGQVLSTSGSFPQLFESALLERTDG